MALPMPTFEQAQIFLHYLVGFRELGISAEGDTASASYASDARAFLEGMMGIIPSPYADKRNKASDEALKLLCDRLHMLVEAYEFGRWPDYKASREENTAMIDAAPEMLSALKIALVELRPRQSFVDMPSRPGDIEDLREKIAAVIAKAEGKS